jgi:hypothetical protein
MMLASRLRRCVEGQLYDRRKQAARSNEASSTVLSVVEPRGTKLGTPNIPFPRGTVLSRGHLHS